MPNPTNVEEYDFGMQYEGALGDPTDPDVEWAPLQVIFGTGQAGLDQALAQVAAIREQVESGGYTMSVRNARVVFTPRVNWQVWEEE